VLLPLLLALLRHTGVVHPCSGRAGQDNRRVERAQRKCSVSTVSPAAGLSQRRNKRAAPIELCPLRGVAGVCAVGTAGVAILIDGGAGGDTVGTGTQEADGPACTTEYAAASRNHRSPFVRTRSAMRVSAGCALAPAFACGGTDAVVVAVVSAAMARSKLGTAAAIAA